MLQQSYAGHRSVPTFLPSELADRVPVEVLAAAYSLRPSPWWWSPKVADFLGGYYCPQCQGEEFIGQGGLPCARLVRQPSSGRAALICGDCLAFTPEDLMRRRVADCPDRSGWIRDYLGGPNNWRGLPC